MAGVTRPAMAAWLSRFLVSCRPWRWRERYGEEVLDVLDQHRSTARTVLNMGASAAAAHLDPAWHGRRPANAGPRWYQTRIGGSVAAFSAVVVLVAGCSGLVAWQDYEGNNGPPMPLSDGAFGMVFSPDGRTVAAINPNLEI